MMTSRRPTPTAIVARRESRIVLPKTLPKPKNRFERGIAERGAEGRVWVVSHRVRPPRPRRGGTRRGTSPRATARARRSRRLRSARRPARPAGSAADAHREGVVGRDHVAHTVMASNARRTGWVKRSSTWWWAMSRSASTRSTRASRPSRMIATRSQVFSTSLRMWLDMKTVRPSAFASRITSKNVCCTSGSRPDVGSSNSSRSGRCWSATTSPIFCLLPFEYSLNLRVGSISGRADQLGLVHRVDPAAQVREVFDRLPAGQACRIAGTRPAGSRDGDGSQRGRPSRRCRRSTPCRSSGGCG